MTSEPGQEQEFSSFFIRLIGGDFIGRSKKIVPVAALAGAMLALVALVTMEAAVAIATGRGYFPFFTLLPVYEAVAGIGAVLGLNEGLAPFRPRRRGRPSPPPQAPSNPRQS